MFGENFKAGYMHMGVGWEAGLFGGLGGPWGSILGNIDHFIRTRLLGKIGDFRFFRNFGLFFEGQKYDFFQKFRILTGGMYTVVN